MKYLLAFLFMLPAVCPLAAQDDYYISGFIDSYHAVRMHEPNDFLSSRNRLRLKGTFYAEDATGFISLDLEQNNVLEDQDELRLREAYIDYFSENWDVRIGRQIIVWGKTDGLQVLDAVSPWDYTEFLARDFEDLRIGVDAIRWRWLGSDWNLELIYLPKFEPARQAPAGSPWQFSLIADSAPALPVAAAEEPEFTLENGEYGARLSFYKSWGDFSLVALRSWTDDALPFAAMNSALRSPGVRLEYQRINIFGAAVSVPSGSVVYRAEAAYYQGAEFAISTAEGFGRQRSGQLKWVAALEWTGPANLTVSAQVTDSQMLDHHPSMPLEEHMPMATLSISKLLYRETLNLSVFSFVGLEHGDTFSRFSADYSLSDAVHLLAGVDVFTGDTGYLAAFNDNDEAWMKFNFSF